MNPEKFDILLVGGPTDTPLSRILDSGDHRITILRGAGRDHYQFTGRDVRDDGRTVLVYRWAYRTRIAE